jgi:hypothetical protein
MGEAKRSAKIDWGSVPQWLSAVAAIVVAWIAGLSYSGLAPIFENQLLKNENARLTLAAEQLRTTNWTFVCRQLATRTSAVVGTTVFVWDFYVSLEGLPFKVLDPPRTDARTTREFLRGEVANDDYNALLMDDAPAFKTFVEMVIREGGRAMDQEFALPDESSQLPKQSIVDRQKLFDQLRDLTMNLESRCQAANPSRNPTPTQAN